LLDRLRIGPPEGGYVLASEGGISVEMSRENFNLILKMNKKYRRNKIML